MNVAFQLTGRYYVTGLYYAQSFKDCVIHIFAFNLMVLEFVIFSLASMAFVRP